MSYLETAEEFREEMAAFRRRIHSRPELGRNEYHTAEAVEQALQQMGIETQRICGTGVVGTLRGASPGRTVAVRADLDALPMEEQTGCAYASVIPGAMHACGHDFHTAALLGAARLLSRDRNLLHGNVRFLFQPDEEDLGGAQRMIDAGCLEQPHVNAVFGMHVSPDLPAGTAGFRYGKFYAASNTFSVRVTGRSCHGAEPEKGINALFSALKMIENLENLRKTLAEKYGRLIITVGKLEAGTAANIVPGSAAFSGIVRTLGPEARRDTVSSLERVIRETAEAYGTQVELTIRESYPGIVNHDAETELALRAAESLLGSSRVIVIDEPTMTTEDFGYFLQERPGAFWQFGVGGNYPLHNPHFLPDEALLPQAAAVHAHIIKTFLEENN